MRRVKFNDGEGVVYSDFDMAGQLADRSATRALREMIQTAVDDVGGADLALLVRGAVPTHSGTGTRTITLTDGLWCAAEDNPAAAAGDVPEVYFGDSTGAAYVLDANTGGAVYRRDILQVKINAASDAVSETRDFKDATTGVVTTQSMYKRSVRTVLISVKKGADQVSEALADSNEPTPDAGYVKIFSFLIDNTGACAAAKRKSYAVGYRIRRSTRQWYAAAGDGSNATLNVATGKVTPTSAGSWLIALGNLAVDDRIDSITLLGDNTGGSLTLTLVKIDGTDGSRDVVSGPSAQSGTWGTGGATLAPVHTVLADGAYYAEINYTSGGPVFSGVKASIRHPY